MRWALIGGLQDTVGVAWKGKRDTSPSSTQSKCFGSTTGSHHGMLPPPHAQKQQDQSTRTESTEPGEPFPPYRLTSQGFVAVVKSSQTQTVMISSLQLPAGLRFSNYNITGWRLDWLNTLSRMLLGGKPFPLLFRSLFLFYRGPFATIEIGPTPILISYPKRTGLRSSQWPLLGAFSAVMPTQLSSCHDCVQPERSDAVSL